VGDDWHPTAIAYRAVRTEGCFMLTGELRNQIDRIWDAFWSGGIANPLEVIEQITYLLFLKRLDDLEQSYENFRWSKPFKSWLRIQH
jgi:type I restriction enzyme M protein